MAAPTYAFYLETRTGEVWIRYFLFFGYNRFDVPADVSGNHFADWVHVSVKLAQQGEVYRPTNYYFSAHDGGENISVTDSRLEFYEEFPSNKRVLFGRTLSNRSKTEEYHVGVYLAKGDHEAYPNAGYHKRDFTIISLIDETDFGSVVVPWADADSNSSLTYHPYLAWNMSDPIENPYFNTNPMTDDQSRVHWLPTIPKTLFGPDDNSQSDPESFFQMFTRKDRLESSEDQRRAIKGSGQQDNFGSNNEDFTATIPPVKIFSWGSNFDN